MQTQATLAGAQFRPADVKDLIREFEIGDQLSLEPDPNNEYDATAVKVIYSADGEDIHVGFLPRSMNEPIFLTLIDGREVTVEIVAFEGALKPVLELTWEE